MKKFKWSINLLSCFMLTSFIHNCTLTSSGKTGCPVTGGNKTITVHWAASRSYDVNTAAGGGHKIYYKSTSGVSKATPDVVNVPNTVSTTSGTITGLSSGCTYFIKVGGYSAINPAGGNLSAESTITIP